jgi:uncharacterized zinc-type alcohol dehydrogenase-like protein
MSIASHPVRAFGATSATNPIEGMTIQRREPSSNDVAIDILFCGICHSDLHQVRSEWAGTMYPCVPGHEIVGRVAKVGSAVTGVKVGDLVGVGCMVDSCRSCKECNIGLEQYCDAFPVFTYNGADRHLGGHTLGGYSRHIVVDQHFVLRIPTNLDPAAAAPLLCAGITTYSPMKHWGVTNGSKVGVVGLGGLGHMGAKFGRALGAYTVVFTTSKNKVDDAMRLGAHEVVLSNDETEMTRHAATFDFILDTVGASHNLDTYTGLLKRDGTLCLVGAPEHPHPSPGVWNLLLKRRRIAGSAIGGIRETQEMLDFCGRHNIASDIELIPASKINEAYTRMLKGDVKYRFVIDIATMG